MQPTSTSGLRPTERTFGERLWLYCRSWWAGPVVGYLRRHAPSLGRVPDGGLLVVAPHPDDESLGCGGLIALKRQRGDAVRVAVLTSGQDSLPGHPTVPPGDLARMRRIETVNALHELGVAETDLCSLHASDGGLGDLAGTARVRLIATLAQIIRDLRPAIIATTFRHDEHPDHEAAYILTWDAIQLAGVPVQLWEYPLWSLWMTRWAQVRQPAFQQFSKVDVRSVLGAKQRAVACHLTQVAPVPPWRRPTLARRFTSRLLHRDELFLRTDLRTPFEAAASGGGRASAPAAI